MLLMFDLSGNRVAEWSLGKKLVFPKTIDAVDITAICTEGLELEFLASILENLVYPKNYSTVWWYGADAKTVASVMESYHSLEKDSRDFLQRKLKIDSAKKKVGVALDKIKDLTFPQS
jgi:hypothetical protein